MNRKIMTGRATFGPLGRRPFQISGAGDLVPVLEMHENRMAFDASGYGGDAKDTPRTHSLQHEADDLLASYGKDEARTVLVRQLDDARRLCDGQRAAWLVAMLMLINASSG